MIIPQPYEITSSSASQPKQGTSISDKNHSPPAGTTPTEYAQSQCYGLGNTNRIVHTEGLGNVLSKNGHVMENQFHIHPNLAYLSQLGYPTAVATSKQMDLQNDRNSGNFFLLS